MLKYTSKFDDFRLQMLKFITANYIFFNFYNENKSFYCRSPKCSVVVKLMIIRRTFFELTFIQKNIYFKNSMVSIRSSLGLVQISYKCSSETWRSFKYLFRFIARMSYSIEQFTSKIQAFPYPGIVTITKPSDRKDQIR